MSAELHILRERNDVVSFLRNFADRSRAGGDGVEGDLLDLIADRIQRGEHENFAIKRGVATRALLPIGEKGQEKQ